MGAAFPASTCKRRFVTFGSAKRSFFPCKYLQTQILFSVRFRARSVGSLISCSRVRSSRESHQQTAEQGAAPDRLQLHSLRSFLTSVIALPAAGELVVRLFARGLVAFCCVFAFVHCAKFACRSSLVSCKYLQTVFWFARRCFIGSFRFGARALGSALTCKYLWRHLWRRASFCCCSVSPAARRLPLVVARFLAPVSLPVATAAFLQVLGAYYFWCQFCFRGVGFSSFAFAASRPKSRAEVTNKQANKALHPTAYSSVRCVRSSLRSLRFRRRVSLSLRCGARLDGNRKVE